MPKAVGIDIGTEALRGVLIESRKGQLQILSAGAAPLGEWAALEDNQDKRLAVGEKLKELVRGAGLRGSRRRIAMTTKGAALKYLSVPPVPSWRLEMLAKYEIEERTENKEPNAYDYRILDVPDISGQYTVILGALHERIADWLMDICRQARLGEVEPDLKAIGLYNAYYHGHGYDPDKTALIVDIGATEISVLVVRNGALYLARTFEGGGQRFTQALSEELRATILEAEEIKKNEAEILFDVTTGATAIYRRSARMSGGAVRRAANGAARDGSAEKPVKETGRPETADAIEVTTEALGETEPQVPASPESTPTAPSSAGPAMPPRAEMVVPLHQLSAEESSGEKKDDFDLRPSGSAPLADAETDADAEKRRRPMSMGDQAFLDELDDLQPAVKRRKQISQLLVRESAALCAALESAINYCRGQYKMRELKVDVVYLTGSASRLKGLSQLICRRLRAPVETLDVFRRLDLSRLPPDAAETLRSEQDRMAVSTGLALSALCGETFSFMLWPTALKEKKAFWARGAYLYYAAASLLAAMAILFFTPYRNAETLAGNEDRMNQAIQQAKRVEQELAMAREEHEELQRRLEQIDLNAKSGAFFLKVLAELKDPKRIPQDVWLTSLSTNLPKVILKESWPERGPAVAEPGAKASTQLPGATPDTFQAQARLYLRGFVRSGQKSDLYNKIMGDRTTKPFFPGFCDLLVPFPDDPDNQKNLFNDIRPVWVERDDHPQQARFLKEFVLEAYVEGSRELGKKPVAPRKTVPVVEPAPVVKTADPVAEETPVPAEKIAADPEKVEVAPAVKKSAPRPTVKQPLDPEPKAF